MYAFIARRLLSTIPVLLIVAVLVFLMLRLTPGDPAAILAGDAASSEQIAAIRASLGLARSWCSSAFGRQIFCRAISAVHTSTRWR
jgi:peptide/nickel transport system permease protein